MWLVKVPEESSGEDKVEGVEKTQQFGDTVADVGWYWLAWLLYCNG